MEQDPRPVKVTVKFHDIEATAYSGYVGDAMLTAFAMLWSMRVEEEVKTSGHVPTVPLISTFDEASLDAFIRTWNEEVDADDGIDLRYIVTVEYL